MGLLGTIARRSTVAALRGGGRLLSRHVVPDSVTPWKLRQKTSSATSGLFSLASAELKRRKRKRLAAQKAEREAEKALRKGLRAAQPKAPTTPKASRPVGSRPWSPPPPQLHPQPRPRRAAVVLPAGKYDEQLSPARQALQGPASVRRRSPASATTKPAGYKPAPAMVRPAVPNEQRFDKNAWGRGQAMRSAGGFDDVRAVSGSSARLGRNRRASKRNGRAAQFRSEMRLHRAPR